MLSKNEFLICGGQEEEGLTGRSRILSISRSEANMVTHRWRGKNEELPIDGLFRQRGSFSVSTDLLTPEFVQSHVSDAAKRAVLLDLKQPSSELLALHGNNGIYIFDKS